MVVDRNIARRLSLRTESGDLDGVKNSQKILVLAYVQDCPGSDCPIRMKCSEEYKHVGKCTIETRFLNTIYHVWIDREEGIGDVITQGQLNRLGTHVMPLYAILIKLQKEFWGIERVVYTDKKGVKHISPVLRELRDTMKAVGYEIDKAGLEKTWEKKWGGGKPLPSGLSTKEQLQVKFGNVGRYAETSEIKKKGVKNGDADDGNP